MSDMTELRVEINRLNNEILKLLSERVQVSLRIGDVKKHLGIPVVDRQRETKVLEQVKDLAQKNDLDPEGVVKVFKEIIRMSVEAQEKER
jgi:chorismate mutase